MKGFWVRLNALLRKEFRQLWRDKSNLAIGIVLPIILIFIFGYGISMDVRNAPIAVVLEDHSPAARDVVSGFYGSDYLKTSTVFTMKEATDLMQAQQVDGIVRVPSNFSESLGRGHADIQILVNGVDAQRASIILSYAQAALAQWQVSQQARGALSGAPASLGQITLEPRMWFNDANTSTWYLVPGLIVLIMTLVGAFLTALVMAREWERGTLEALFVTPVRPVEILLAKIVPYFCVGMLGLMLCLLAAKFLFGVPMHGSLLVILLSSMLYLGAALGMGLLISAVTKSQFLASQVALLASFMPALMLSGFMFDLRNTPPIVRVISQILPATHFMDLIKSLFLAGNVWPQIFRDCGILLLQSVVLLGLARWFTRKQLDQ